jgi:acetyl-CoA C-acetyltransferase
MAKEVFVLGGYQTDFARNFAREGLALVDLVRESVLGACESGGEPPRATTGREKEHKNAQRN